MAIHRSKVAYFSGAERDVVTAVRKVLNSSPTYENTLELEGRRRFQTNVKPNVLFLSTPMSVTIHTVNGEVVVTVETQSQAWVMGDIFDMYNRYINNFLRELNVAVRNPTR
jgi:hypothetical protein